jgi:hypothetical protein
MFKLTKQEQLIVGLIVGALIVGAAVRHWRALAGRAQADQPLVTRQAR